MRYQFIEEYRGEYAVNILCETLEVSVSGYYDWRKRPMSQRAQADIELAEQIRAAYHACRRTYGSPRLSVELHEQGVSCSRKRVARLMREMGLSARRARHRTRTTCSDPAARVAPNVLNRDFVAGRPNEKWAGDITAIWTYEGWLYLAVVLDLFSRQVIGWAMAATKGMRPWFRGPSAWRGSRGAQKLAYYFIPTEERSIPAMPIRPFW